MATEDTLGVPPAGRVHLAVAGDNQAKLEKAIGVKLTAMASAPPRRM
jgi:hypothetical protein